MSRRAIAFGLCWIVIATSLSAVRSEEIAQPGLTQDGSRILLTNQGTVNLATLNWVTWRFGGASQRADWHALKRWLAARQRATTDAMRKTLVSLPGFEDEALALPTKCYRALLCTQVEAVVELGDFFDDAKRLRTALAEAEPFIRGFVGALDLANDLRPVGLDDDALPEAKLMSRVFRDQMLRKSGAGSQHLSPDARLVANELLKIVSAAADYDNMTFLETEVVTDGWPRASDLGEHGATYVWLLAQHADVAPDLQFRVLQLITPLANSGDVAKRNLAYLSDRVAVNLGEKQLYGTQLHCVNEVLEVAPIAIPEKLDERRAEMGLPPMSGLRRALKCSHGP